MERQGVELTIFQSQVRRPSHYTIEPLVTMTTTSHSNQLSRLQSLAPNKSRVPKRVRRGAFRGTTVSRDGNNNGSGDAPSR